MSEVTAALPTELSRPIALSVMRGAFLKDASLRREFLSLLTRKD